MVEKQPKPSAEAQAESCRDAAAAGPPGQAAADASASRGDKASQAAPTLPTGEIARLRAELEDANDRALRGWAELENYRKRANRLLDEERRYAALPLVRDVLPVLDNVKRAVEAAEKTHDTASLLEGIKMVVQQLEDVLARHHCTPIIALNRPFDPNFHAAIMHQPAAGFPPNTVVQEIHQGFQLHDRVVRPSQVIVSSPAETPRADSPGNENNQV